MDKTELFLQNQKFASYISSKWFATTLPEIHEDIMGEARIGLWKACRTFDAEKGFKFSTYASRVINNQIRMFMRGRKNSISEISLETDLGDGMTFHDTLSFEQDYTAPIADAISKSLHKYKYLKMHISGMSQKASAEKQDYRNPI